MAKNITFLVSVFTLALCGMYSKIEAQDNNRGRQRPNVLFIAVDDMADWTGYLGHPDAITPHMDRLANRGAIFTQAHATSPICGPSRAAVLSGLRPETSGVYHNAGKYDDYLLQVPSIPKYFRNHNYHVMGAGKLFHGHGSSYQKDAFDEYGPGVEIVGTPFTDEELSTSNMPAVIDMGSGREPASLPFNGLSTIDRPTNRWSTFDWGPLDVPDEEMPDGKIANWAVDKLSRKYDKPFFLGVGFYKPHQPLYAPKKYFEMYDIHKISLPPTIVGDMYDLPPSATHFAHAAWTAGKHATVVKHNQWKEGVLGYLATITFADAMVGRVLDALDNSPYRDNTLIVFWSDHGWHLGEKEHWGKHSPWKEATRVPLIIVPPKNWLSNGFHPSERINVPVNLLDIYPTLLDFCGLPFRKDLQGKSLIPLINNPAADEEEVSVSTIGRGTHTITSRDWSYVHYYDGTEELYHLPSDPYRWFNLAKDARYLEVKEKLSEYIVEDNGISRYVRYGNWKAVFKTDGSVMLFDLSQGFGISEQFDIASENLSVITFIKNFLEENNIHSKYVSISG